MSEDVPPDVANPLARRIELAPGGSLQYWVTPVGEILIVVAGTGTLRSGEAVAARLEPGRPVRLEPSSLCRLDSGPDGLTFEVHDTPPRCGCC